MCSAIVVSSRPTWRSSPTSAESTPCPSPRWRPNSWPGISSTGRWPTRWWSRAPPPGSPRHWPTSSVSAAPFPARRWSWAVASLPTPSANVSLWRMPPSSAPGSSATATSASRSIRSACVAWSGPRGSGRMSVAGVRRRRGNTALAIVVLALAACQTLGPSHTGRLRALEPSLGQLLLVGFTGTAGDGQAEPERLICDVRVGGILIFGRNVVTPGQLARLTAWMSTRAQACTGGTLLVAVDAEGGRVMRLSPRAGFPPSPSHQELGTADDLGFTEQEARRMGAMLREAGINWNLAPVVDVAINPTNPVIVGTGRSFGADPERVAAQARAFIRGMHAEGLLTSDKNFPGHGSHDTVCRLG